MCEAAQQAAIRRIEQAGDVSLTALQVLLRSAIGNNAHMDEVMAVVQEHFQTLATP